MISNKLYEMREGGNILGGLLDKEILCRILEGVSTIKLDQFIEEYIRDNRAIPILKGYLVDNDRYEHASCISINEQVVHGVPSNRELKEGDLVTIDVSLKYGEHCVDAARTFVIGEPNDRQRKLLNVAKSSFDKGFSSFKVGNKIGDVSSAVQHEIEKHGLKVIKTFCGHSIGRELHEEISVFNYGEEKTGEMIYPYLAIALEPMISEADEYTAIDSDGWSAYTLSGSLSSHYEDTIIALDEGPENLTARLQNV